MSGFVRIYRRLFDNPVFRTEIEALIFARLIIQAAWKDTEIKWKGRRFQVKRSELIISYREMAERFGGAEVTHRRLIERLTSDAMIVAVTDAGVTRISICNYDKYQVSSNDRDADDGAVDDALLTQSMAHDWRTFDAPNKVKEVKEVKDPPPIVPPQGEKRARGSRIPDDWKPNEADRDFAQQLSLDPDAIGASFRDFWKAKAGAGGSKLDWSATWRNWCRKEAERVATKPAAKAIPGAITPAGGVANSEDISAMVGQTYRWVQTPAGMKRERVV